jgi:REP element-mobilizing transposase RayT
MSGPQNWYHITLSTYNSWLPGDPRGWRSWHHKTHSTGHHRAPPPADEHANILKHAQSISTDVVIISNILRAKIGQLIVEYLGNNHHELLAIAVDHTHVHVQVRLPSDDAKNIMGKCKRKVSYATRDALPGKLWSRGIGITQITNKSHQQSVFKYILRHQEHGAWVWSYRDS